MSILLYNGKIIAEAGVIDSGYLLIKDSIISSVGSVLNLPGSRLPAADEKIDIKGLTLIPGLIDVHFHGMLDISLMEGEEEDIERLLKELVKYGVTGFLATTMAFPVEGIIKQVKKIKSVKERSALSEMLLGVHLEGPWLSMKMRGAHPKEYVINPKADDVNRIINEIGDIVKSVTFSPEIDNAVWLTETLSENGIIPVIGHTGATYEQVSPVIEAGARHVTHMFDAMHGFSEKSDELGVMDPGVETAVLLNDSVSIELIGCPIHVPLPFFKLIDRIKPHDKKILVTDAGTGAGMADGTIVKLASGRKAYVKNGVLRLIAEDDPKLNNGLAGSAVTINVALKRLVTLADISIENAVKWATINPATLLGIRHLTGSIRPGKRADLAVLDRNYNVKLTVLNGQIVYRGGK